MPLVSLSWDEIEMVRSGLLREEKHWRKRANGDRMLADAAETPGEAGTYAARAERNVARAEKAEALEADFEFRICESPFGGEEDSDG